MGLIGIIASSSYATAIPSGSVQPPVGYNVYKGYLVSGNLSSLKYNDNNIFHARGRLHWPMYWIGVTVDFNSPPGSYQGVVLAYQLMYNGDEPIRIMVRYTDGTTEHFFEWDTGTQYRTRSYTLDPYKKVDYVDFSDTYSNWFFGGFIQNLYIDYVFIGYENPP